MATFVYRPYREIVIHEMRELEVEPFMEGYVSQLLSQGQAGITPVATWIDGVAFYIGQFMETQELIKEKLEGRIHWAAVYYTKTSFQPEKKVTVSGREYVVKFNKGESNPDFVDLVQFLNKQPVVQSHS
jgi:hypothetical protein